jgi:hypothetical protein
VSDDDVLKFRVGQNKGDIRSSGVVVAESGAARAREDQCVGRQADEGEVDVGAAPSFGGL